MIKPLLTTALAVALTYLIKMYTIKITCNESLDHAWCYVEWRNEVWKKGMDLFPQIRLLPHYNVWNFWKSTKLFCRSNENYYRTMHMGTKSLTADVTLVKKKKLSATATKFIFAILLWTSLLSAEHLLLLLLDFVTVGRTTHFFLWQTSIPFPL